MQHGTLVNGFNDFGINPGDENYMKYVGYSEDNDCIKYYFSEYVVHMISKRVTLLLHGVLDKDIIVPDETIYHIMSVVYETRVSRPGDIFSRYIIPQGTVTNVVQEMIDRVIEIITSQIRNEYDMLKCNQQLSIWDATLLGDFNKYGLRQYPPIKLCNKHPAYFQFNMNY